MISPVNVQVGKDYEVPCVQINGTRQVIPVLLPAHIDDNTHCLQEAAEHYHIDFRFITKGETCDYNAWYAKNVSKVFYHKIRALKTSVHSFEEVGESSFFFINRWYRRYGDSTLKNGRCPHQGVQVVNACGVCPAHGLPWDLNTGRLRNLKLPFYLELSNDGNHNHSNPRGIITEDNQCVIEPISKFESNGTVIMVDSQGQKCTNATQKVSFRNFDSGDKLTFHTEKICTKERFPK